MHFIFKNLFCEFLRCVIFYCCRIDLNLLFVQIETFTAIGKDKKLGFTNFSFKFQTPDTLLNTINNLNSTNKIWFCRQISEHNLNVAWLFCTAQLFSEISKNFCILQALCRRIFHFTWTLQIYIPANIFYICMWVLAVEYV